MIPWHISAVAGAYGATSLQEAISVLHCLQLYVRNLKSILLNTRRQRQLHQHDEAKEDQEVNQATQPATSYEVDRSGSPFKAMFCINY